MSIHVVCPGCQAEFKVGDQYAGKRGPCPKCKAPITIPGAATKDEVKVHAPEDAPTGSAQAQKREITKPIARRETAWNPVFVAISALAALSALASAAFLSDLWQSVAMRAVALLVVGPPICAAGYAVLREDELVPHQGRSLWLRSAICAAVYALTWSPLLLVAPDLLESFYIWLVLLPALVSVAVGAAYLCFDFDFGSGVIHYGFYVALMLLLGALAGLQMPWVGVSM